jgi:acylphosphatase
VKRFSATVTGLVQGVAFRAYTQREATRLGLTGWVANRWDGTVQVVAEGSEAPLTQLVQWLQHGSPAAQVERVNITWAEATGEFSSFQIRY